MSPFEGARAGWRWLFLAATIWTTGILIWTWEELVAGRFSPSPGATDIGPVGFGIFSLLAVVALLKPPGLGRVTLPKVLEFTISIGIVALVTGTLFFRPFSEHSFDIKRMLVPAFNSITYSIGLVTGIFYFSRGQPRSSQETAVLVLLGLSMNLGAHFAFVYAQFFFKYEAGLIMDVLWISAFIAIALAGALEVQGKSNALDSFASNSGAPLVAALVWSIFLGGLCLGLFSYRELVPTQLFVLLGGALAIAVLIIAYLQLNWAKEIKLRQDLEEALKARDKFIAVASHELKTPLTSLAGNITLLEKLHSSGNLSVQEPLSLVEILDRSRRQLNYLTRLAESLLDVRRLSSGRLDLQCSTFDLVELVKNVVCNAQREIKLSKSEVTLMLPEKCIGIWDELRLEQALSNLLSNALKFGAGKPVTIQIEDRDDWEKLIVSDRGIGIDPKDQEKIFDKFERSVSTRNYPGLGLGLYLAAQIASAHGGKLQVDSRLGEGSTFTLSIPRRVTATSVEGAAA
ncbi:MAG: sensor histidine kinase [Bdellovibrionota bacterium]